MTEALRTTLARTHPANDVLNETLAVDTACQQEAVLAGLPGSYVALVSTPSRSLKHLLLYQYREGMPVVNTKVSSYLSAYDYVTNYNALTGFFMVILESHDCIIFERIFDNSTLSGFTTAYS